MSVPTGSAPIEIPCPKPVRYMLPVSRPVVRSMRLRYMFPSGVLAALSIWSTKTCPLTGSEAIACGAGFFVNGTVWMSLPVTPDRLIPFMSVMAMDSPSVGRDPAPPTEIVRMCHTVR